MPTNLDRIQTLLQPEEYAVVKTLAGHNRRALSAMSAELIREALKLPKYRQQVQDALIQVPEQEDKRSYIPQTRTDRRWCEELTPAATATPANWWEAS